MPQDLSENYTNVQLWMYALRLPFRLQEAACSKKALPNNKIPKALWGLI